MSQVDLRHIRTRMQCGTPQAVPTGGPTYKPFHPYAKIVPHALSRAETCQKMARREAKRQGPLPTLPPSHPQASSHVKDASDMTAFPIEDTAVEEPTPPVSPTKCFLSSSAGALVGFFNKITRGALRENTGRKRGREEDEKDGEDDHNHDHDKSEDVSTLHPDLFRVRKRRREVDLEWEQLGCDSNEATDDMQGPGTDDRADGEGERDDNDNDREVFCGAISSEGGEDGEETFSNVSIRTTDDQATEEFDPAVGDSARVEPGEGEEREDEGDLIVMKGKNKAVDVHVGPSKSALARAVKDLNSCLDSDSDSDSDTTEEGDGGMSDDDMLGNTFQLMDVETSSMPEQGGKHHQAGDLIAVKGKNKAVDVHAGPSKSALTRAIKDSNSGSGSDSDTTEEGDGGMSDDDVLGNTFQLMDVETSSMPEQGGKHHQAGDLIAVKGKNKAVDVHAGPSKSALTRAIKDSNSGSGSDSDTTEEGDGGMSDDDVLGNTFQLMDVETSSMPEQGGKHHQAGDLIAVKGKNKAVDVHVGPSKSTLAGAVKDSNSGSGSDSDSDSGTTEEGDGGMSDNDMLGNTFQLMDVETSSMPEQGGEHNQVGDLIAVKGKNKVVGVHAGPSKSARARDVNNTTTVATVGPKHGQVEDVTSVKGKSKPLKGSFFMPSPLVPQSPPRPSGGFTPGRKTGCQAECNDKTECQPHEDIIESKIRANIWQELGKIVESSVAVALEKALPGLTNQSAENGAGTSSSQTKTPKTQAPSYNEFKKSVRELGQELLGIEDREDLPRSVGRREISAWDPKSGPCCTVEDFRIDLEGLPRSEWNKSAALVFAQEYLKRCRGHQGENYTLEYIVKAWLTHVMTLRMRYKVKELDDEDRTECKAWNRRHQRKHETAYEYGEIKDRAVAIVESLGQDGMSSDESDHEGHWGEATYYILEKDWRSKQTTAGAWPHFRMASLNDSKGPPVTGLPIDFYSRNWYGAQNAFMREQLQATNQSDTLAIPSQHAKIAEKYNLSDCRVVHRRMFS
ncbi:hypothetical protein BKA82DRAFT_4013063 [Pisolithus tinctorius]|nr:hypothetical protein BKA82DRAFT_4013063 [Pisolithus tinctorius]